MSRLSAPQQHIRTRAEERVVNNDVPAGETSSRSMKQNIVLKSMRKRLLRWLCTISADQIVYQDEMGQTVCGEPHTPRLSATLQVTNARFFWHLLTGGSLGVAEAYLRGYWRADDLVTLMRILARHTEAVSQADRSLFSWLRKPGHRILNFMKRNSRTGSKKNISAHYDLSNEFFALFLDPTMTYSSGIFPAASSTLEEASLAKYERICQKLQLSQNDHLLEIGTGWGGFAIYAASKYGCQVTTTTISKQQRVLAEQRIQQAGLAGQIHVLERDYRDLQGMYNKLVSIEMIEAVGHAYLPQYFQKCSDLLKPDGIFVLQAITIPDQRYETYRQGVDFIQRYIFPGGCLPSLGAIHKAISGKTDFQLVHLEDFAAHYARTLAAWHLNFKEKEKEIRQLGMDDRFVRTWEYYFAYCQAGFEERQVGVSQFVFTKGKTRGKSSSSRIDLLPAAKATCE